MSYNHVCLFKVVIMGITVLVSVVEAVYHYQAPRTMSELQDQFLYFLVECLRVLLDGVLVCVRVCVCVVSCPYPGAYLHVTVLLQFL